MIININKKHFFAVTFAIFLSACGGGGGSSVTSLSSLVDTSDPTQFDNEPYTKYAWHFSEKNNSFSNINNIDPNSHINMIGAWNLSTGSYKVGALKDQAVKVAIIDDNFNINHEDFKDNVIAKCNFNNYFGAILSSDVLTYCNQSINQDVSPSTGSSSHGTAVTNFIAGASNSKGLIGAAPDAQVILIKQEFVSDTMTTGAFEYARAMGAKVINCSWGTTNGPSAAVTSKIAELKAEGINIVFAAGNDNLDLDASSLIDESELESVIGVGSSNSENDRSSFSNYGSAMDIMAPGGGIIGVLSAFVPNSDSDAVTNGLNIDNQNYSFTQGTSFSAPITSGVIALMLGVNPDLTPDEIRTILIETADKIKSDTESYIDIVGDGTTSTFNTQRAYGKINAAKAIIKAKSLY